MTETIHRRELFRRGALLGGGLASLGPLSAYYARAAEGRRSRRRSTARS
jgi:hypothetical protein